MHGVCLPPNNVISGFSTMPWPIHSFMFLPKLDAIAIALVLFNTRPFLRPLKYRMARRFSASPGRAKSSASIFSMITVTDPDRSAALTKREPKTSSKFGMLMTWALQECCCGGARRAPCCRSSEARKNRGEAVARGSRGARRSALRSEARASARARRGIPVRAGAGGVIGQGRISRTARHSSSSRGGSRYEDTGDAADESAQPSNPLTVTLRAAAMRARSAPAFERSPSNSLTNMFASFSTRLRSAATARRFTTRAPALRGSAIPQKALSGQILPIGRLGKLSPWSLRVGILPCGEDRLGPTGPAFGRPDDRLRPSEKGVAGHGAPDRRGTQVCQPQGPGLTDHVGLAPAADVRRAGFDREPYPGDPPPRSAFGRVGPPPQRGRGIARRLCENPIARPGS